MKPKKTKKNPRGAGRKSLGLSHSFSVQVTVEQLEWLEAQRGTAETRSHVIRRMIDRLMKEKNPTYL